MSKTLTPMQNILAEIDTYTDYCKLIDYQIDKAKEYVAKNAALIQNQASTIVAAFPYGVGPAIMAARIQIKQAQQVIADAAEQIAVPIAIAEKLATLTPPSGPCELNDLP